MDRMEIAARIEKIIADNPVDGKPLSSYKLEKLGIISSSTLSNTLTGKVRPNKSSLSKLAEFYHVSLDWLMTGKESEIVLDDPSVKVCLDIIQKLSRSLEARDNEIERLHKIIESALGGSHSPTPED